MLKAATVFAICFGAMAGYYFLVKTSVTWIAGQFGIAAMAVAVLLFVFVCYRIAQAIERRDAIEKPPAEAEGACCGRVD